MSKNDRGSATDLSLERLLLTQTRNKQATSTDRGDSDRIPWQLDVTREMVMRLVERLKRSDLGVSEKP
jgi:hypothetical protein